jgi:DNA-binding beta-propeller fold protein YncE
VFPAAIGGVVGGPPRLPAGQRIVRFLSSKAAQIAVPGRKGALVESMQPMAIETSRGHRAPVDLALSKVGGVFESVRPLVGVLIPQKLSQGVALPEAGVSLTPVSSEGVPLGGAEGLVDGSSVLYANTQTDSDTAVKPTTNGVEASTILRSINSPDRLYFRVGLPPGASLVQAHDAGGDGQVRVMSGGREVVQVRPPSARDAEGTSVPVSMSIRGDLLTLSVAAGTGEYRRPIMVDPEMVKAQDSELGPECQKSGEPERLASNWCWLTIPEASNFTHEWDTNLNGKQVGIHIGTNINGVLSAGNYAQISYTTHGESKIYKLETQTTGFNFSRSEARIALETPAKVEAVTTIEKIVGGGGATWEKYSEVSAAGTPGNTAILGVEALENEAHAEVWVYGVDVYIEQEKSPEETFNESESTIDSGRANVLYKSMSGSEWLGPYQGAFEVKAKDPGIGISGAQVTIGGFRQGFPLSSEQKCKGVQCPEEFYALMSYNHFMPEGEPTLEWEAENFANYDECLFHSKCPVGVTRPLKVDAKPPGKLEVTGWSASREISAARHTLTVSATDEAPSGSHSSGVKSIAVSIDGGQPTSLAGASCAPGTCTASGKYTLAGEGLSEGVHRLVVVATDNASNVSPAREFTFDVRHATPVSVGPGAVDPTTGQFKLSATDVSLAGAGAVSRVSESRDPAVGAGGPLGPQWALGLGDGEGLTVLPTGGVVLHGSSGGATTFTRNGKGEFESPLGDGNLKIEAKEETKGKGIGEYLLVDSKAGTKTTFKQPAGVENTAPSYTDQFGPEAGVLNRPVSDAIDSSGNVWVTDWADNRIAKFTNTGALIGAYGFEGSESGEFRLPFGIAVNQGTDNVYVSDYGNSRIDEYSSSGAFVRAFGWGVSNGEAALQSCTSGCKAGLGGGGAGQLSEPDGVAIDSSGNVWVAEEGNNRVQEFSETGGYVTSFGSAGSGAGQFQAPMDIAFAGGDVYVTDENNNRVDEFSTSGAFIKTVGWGVANGESKLQTCASSCRAGIAGSGNGQFYAPRGLTTDPISGNLYVVDMNSDCVQEVTTAGAFVTKVCSGGSGPGQFNAPMGVAVSSAGMIYITDFNNARVQEWSRPTWLPTLAEGPLKSTTAAYAYTPVEEEGTTVIEPTEELAPAPAGVKCVGEHGEVEVKYLEKGCRALTFNYATATTATGEKESEWGDYTGHLTRVYLHAWDPAKGAMSEVEVAHYLDDRQGRLRAEWDPRIEKSEGCGKTCTALKTTYGYDAEGHVTAMTRPGLQPWAFTYGTIAGDANTGRLLKVTQGHPKVGESEEEVKKRLGEEKEAPVNTEVPKLSGSPVVGVRMAVAHGTWTHFPVVYTYQWERCNTLCEPILGATNANYTPTVGDVNHEMRVEVSAINSGGAVGMVTAYSGLVHESSSEKTEGEYHAPEPGTTVEYRVPVAGEGAPHNMSKEEVEKWGQKDKSEQENNDPTDATAIFPPDEPQGWPASGYKRATIDYMNEKGLVVNAATPSGGISTSEYNELNEVVRTLSADNRVAAMNEGCISVEKKECKSAEVSEKLDTKTEYNPEGNEIIKILGPEHKIKLSSGSEVQARAVTRDYYDEGAEQAEGKNEETYNLLTKSTSGALLSNGEEKDVRTTVTSYSGQEDLGWKLRKPTSTTTDPSNLDLVHKTFYDKNTGNVIQTRAPAGNSEHVSPPYFSLHFGGSGSGNGQFKEPWAVALDSTGNVWALDTGNGRVEKFSATGGFIGAYGKVGTGDLEFKERMVSRSIRPRVTCM